MLEESDPYTGWTSYDYRLQEAVNILDREVCKQCGNPVWLCHSTNNFIEFDVRTGACYGKTAIEEYEKDESKPKLGPGEFHYAVAIGLENEDGSFEPLPRRLEAMTQIG